VTSQRDGKKEASCKPAKVSESAHRVNAERALLESILLKEMKQKFNYWSGKTERASERERKTSERTQGQGQLR
jgi:hypothetical protein